MQVILYPKGDVKSIINFDSDVITVERLKADRNFADCGHVTFWQVSKNWTGFFDFRYNKARAGEHYENALEFLETAKDRYEKGKLRPFVDNLFSAMELLVESRLFVMSEQKYVDKPSHKWTKRKFSSFISDGNMNSEYSKVLGRLSQLRDAARYNKKEFKIDNSTASEYVRLVEQLADDVKKAIV